MNITRAFAFLALFGAAQVQAAPAFSQLYVFGDSLSDNGNDLLFSKAFGGPPPLSPPYTSLVPSAPYAPFGTFSNGPVWVNAIDHLLTGGLVVPSLVPNGAPTGFAFGADFAFGGAVTGPLTGVQSTFIPTLKQQADAAVSVFGGHVPSTALYAVWGGGNDVRAADALNASNPALAAQILTDGVNNLSAIITELANAGAKHFLVPNVPNLGLTPEALSLGLGVTGTALSTQFDVSLAQKLPQLMSSLHIDLTAVDIFSLVTNEHDHPGNFGLTNVTDACTQQNNNAGCANPDQFLFWDGIHPTARQQLGIAQAFSSALTVPLPGAFWLLGPAIGGLISRHRRPA